MSATPLAKREEVRRTAKIDPRMEEDESPAPSSSSTSSAKPSATVARGARARSVAVDTSPASARSAPSGVAPEVVTLRGEVARLTARLEASEARLEESEARRAEASAALDAERKAHERALADLRDAHTASLRALEEAHARPAVPAPEQAPVAPPPVSDAAPASAEAPKRSPKYYDAKPGLVVDLPQAKPASAGMVFLKRLVQLSVVVGIAAAAYTQRDAITQTFHRLTAMPNQTGARAALAGIVEQVGKVDGTPEMPTPETFSGYLKKNVHLANGNDPSIDAWSTPYRLELDDKNLTVRSAGADLAFDTDDDVTVSRPRVAP